MPRLKKGSAAAKAYMAKIRAKKSGGKKTSGVIFKEKKKKIISGTGYSVYKSAPADVKKLVDNLETMYNANDIKKVVTSLAKKGYYIELNMDGSVAAFKKIKTKAKAGNPYYFGEGKKVTAGALKVGHSYEWILGAEYLEVIYIGKTASNKNIKAGSKFGSGGYLFKFNDGGFTDLSAAAVVQNIRTIPSQVGYKSDCTKILKASSKLIKGYIDKGYNRKEAVNNANLDAAHLIQSNMHRGVSGVKKLTKTQLIQLASNYAYVTSGNEDRAIWNILDPDYTESLIPKYKAAIAKFEKETGHKLSGTNKPASRHKDTKSHNVNIKVVSGYAPQREMVIGKVAMATKLTKMIPQIKVRVSRGKSIDNNIMNSPKLISEGFKKYINKNLVETQEFFAVMYLNNALKCIGVYMVGQGGYTEVVAERRLILSSALLTAATGFVLCHNHPSGNLTPSEADKKFTESIIKAAKTIDVKVLDHIILTKDSYFSFVENRIL